MAAESTEIFGRDISIRSQCSQHCCDSSGIAIPRRNNGTCQHFNHDSIHPTIEDQVGPELSLYMQSNPAGTEDQLPSPLAQYRELEEIMQKARIGRTEKDSCSNAPGSGGVGHDGIDPQEDDVGSTAAPNSEPAQDKVHPSHAIYGVSLNFDAASTTVVEPDQEQKAASKQLSNGENPGEAQQLGNVRVCESNKDCVNSEAPASSSSSGGFVLYRRRDNAPESSRSRSELLALHQQNAERADSSPDLPKRKAPANVSTSDGRAWGSEFGGYADTRFLVDQSDVFGTSIPKAQFITPGSARRGEQSFAKPMSSKGAASPGLLQSYATAHSSLASYASAPSGPRRIWIPAIVHEKRVANLLIENDEDIEYTDFTATAESDQADIESLANAISARILEDRYSFRDGGSCYRLPVTSKDKIRFKGEKVRAAMYENLSQLESVQLSGKETITQLLSSIIRMIANEARTFLRERNGFLWDSVYDINNLQRDVALLIYEYASSKPHLRSHVPARQYWGSQPFTSEWLIYLNSRGLILDNSQALDWSGRGQHVEYAPDEGQIIPLKEGPILGYSSSAVVQSVRCRRIQLARKLIRCNKRLTREVAITEVEHLQHLHHRHIVRLVGTYVLKKDLAILIYPVAQWNLDEYLDEIVETQAYDAKRETLKNFLGCLSTALYFIHARNIKHMDIKPGNILIRSTHDGDRVYIADFGIARAYKTADEACTDSPTPFTRIYAAPEVAMQDKRGFSADVFSLGCVFMEIMSVLASAASLKIDERAELAKIRQPPNDISFHANVNNVSQWFKRVTDNRHVSFWSHVQYHVGPTLNIDSNRRPTAGELMLSLVQWDCGHCNDGAEPFEAAVDE